MATMPPPAPASLKAFLATARRALASPPSQRPSPLTFVVGNESADLDSLCSALLLAYLRSHAPAPGQRRAALHIPLSNLPRADLALRPELAAVLRRAGLAGDDLLTLSELPPPADLAPAATRWLLVDHNALTGALAGPYAGRVVGCVDHHDDEGAVPASDPDGQGAPRVIERAGSCASLVVDHAQEAWAGLAPGGEGAGAGLDAQLAHLALGPILVDTANLASPDKTTDRDVRAVEFAEARLRRSAGPPGAAPYDRAAYFRELSRLKDDLSGLSYRDVLRKDYKQWSDGGLVLGVSSAPQGFDYLLREVGDERALLGALEAFAAERRLDLAAVMTATREGGRFGRELLVWALNGDARRAAETFFERSGGELGLETLRGGALDGEDGERWRAAWRQGRTGYSRKQVAPMLRAAMREAPKP